MAARFAGYPTRVLFFLVVVVVTVVIAIAVAVVAVVGHCGTVVL